MNASSHAGRSLASVGCAPALSPLTLTGKRQPRSACSRDAQTQRPAPAVSAGQIAFLLGGMALLALLTRIP